MNKQEKNLLEQIANLLAKRATPPILFTSKCVPCNENTVHLSHIAREWEKIMYLPVIDSVGTMAANILMPGGIPIKTCLSCGETIYTEKK